MKCCTGNGSLSILGSDSILHSTSTYNHSAAQLSLILVRLYAGLGQTKREREPEGQQWRQAMQARERRLTRPPLALWLPDLPRENPLNPAS